MSKDETVTSRPKWVNRAVTIGLIIIVGFIIYSIVSATLISFSKVYAEGYITIDYEDDIWLNITLHFTAVQKNGFPIGKITIDKGQVDFKNAIVYSTSNVSIAMPKRFIVNSPPKAYAYNGDFVDEFTVANGSAFKFH